MRFLIIDANYPGFLEGLYTSDADLAEMPYEEQRARIRSWMFGEAGFQVNALQELGHEADVIVTNAHAAQEAWAREHRVSDSPGSRWKLRLRRGVVPWLYRTRTTSWEILLAQVADYRPDVLYIGILDSIPSAVVRQLRRYARFVVAQIAAAVPDGTYAEYDLVFSSIPAIVNRFRQMNIAAEWLPLAFEPSVLARLPSRDRDVPVSFIGSFSDAHPGRIELIEAVDRVAPVTIWTSDIAFLAHRSELGPRVQGPAFGRDMYTALARSQITLNMHATWAGQDANNLRLFEATGMGSVLVTDHKDNLEQLFRVGSEVVAYRTPAEAADLVRYFVARPNEGAAVAAGGQARTLRDHTWTKRMEVVAATVKERI